MNVKLSNSQLNKLKSTIKNGTDVVLRLSSNMIDNSKDETNFPDKLLPVNRQVANLCRAFAKHTSTNVNLSKTAGSSAADAGIHKKILGCGHNTTLIISNAEKEDISKIVKSLKISGILLKGVSETIKNEAKRQKGGFLSMLLGTLGASLLGDMLLGKGVIRAGEGTARVSYGSKKPLKFFFDSSTSLNKL